MSLSSEDAANALREVQSVSVRSGQLYRYQRAAPMLMLWGAIWLVGFGLSYLFPARAGVVWAMLDVAGLLGSAYLIQRREPRDRSATTGRWLGSMLAIFGFYLGALLIFAPVTGAQAAALIALLVALFYVLAGLWLGARFAVAGVALAAATLFGYFELAAYFYLWMAVVGGGALILAGLWLRRT